ncbi:hypothetical protein FACS189490_03310 [Clostridia bacterium]|nr:hypothetical protein FACS189490_03310 [Clostridia bacterium]
MNATSNKLTVLYCRLSRDDNDGERDSESISNQKKILVEYAERNGFTPYVIEQEACDIIEPNPGSPADTGFQGIWFILYYA